MLALSQRYLQDSRLLEYVAQLSMEQLLLEEEVEKKQAAAKKAKKQKAKAAKQQQKQQQQQQQSDSEPESESASEYVLKAPKAALFAVEPESTGPEVDTDDWSISKAATLSTKRGLKAAPAISTAHDSRMPVGDSRLAHSSTSPDCILAASEPPQSNLLPQAMPSVTAEGSFSSAVSLQSDSKHNKKVMDLFLCPITQVLGFDNPQMHSIAEAIACCLLHAHLMAASSYKCCHKHQYLFWAIVF